MNPPAHFSLPRVRRLLMVGMPFALIGGLLVKSQAGDILRGGAPQNSPRAPGNSAATAAASDAARANARDALSRTAKSIQAVQNLQNQARNLSRKGPNNLGADPNHPGMQLPNVPNGLGPGGLDFINATGLDPSNAVKQSLINGLTNVTVKQKDQQALINWKTFNVGLNTHLHFDQSAGGESVGQWIAFNRVTDPSGSPSQILGSITAPGQVYVINQNGIIFGGTSQVNVHTLVASSLPINENLINRGLLNNPDSQFLFTSMALPQGSKGTPAFTPPASFLPGGRVGDVTVQAGAVLTSPTSADRVGGRIALLGANVTNEGTISTPDGQTILAAGLQVGFTAHDSKDPSLRGLDVYIGAVTDPASALAPYAGTVTNRGLIESPRGSITIAGKNVNQLGVLNSSTSVSLNGRIDLIASYGAQSNPAFDAADLTKGPQFLNRETGSVELGPGSVMQILPEWASVERVAGTKLPLNSQINVTGKTIHMASDSVLLAPNADVMFRAGVWQPFNGLSRFTYANGQIYLEPGALINVAGTTDAVAPMSQNIVKVQLRGSELADSPLQRDGLLRGVDLVIDLRKTGVYNGVTWYGTPLADASGFLNLVQRTVSELTTAGGTVKLNSGNSVVVQQGAKIDVSGGWTNYEGGQIQTTRVLSNGHIFDISQATPDLVYDGIYDGLFKVSHPKWGVTDTFVNPFMLGAHFEPGYQFGAAGGTLGITAPSMALDGDFFGNTINGPRQREVLAKVSELALAFTGEKNVSPYLTFSPTPPAVIFQDGSLPAAGPFTVDAGGNPAALSAARRARVLLSPELLTTRGFGSLRIDNPDGDITVPSGTDLIAPAGGSITLNGANVRLQGNVTVPGGTLNLTAYNISPSVAAELALLPDGERFKPSPNPGRGNVSVGNGVALSTAGLVVDDRLSAPNPLGLPLLTNGGSINITAYSASLQAGSVLDVSGGVAMSALGKTKYGNGGSINIKTGQDPTLPEVLGGRLELGSTLKGFAGVTARGGSLSLQAYMIQVGGSGGYPGGLLLQPEFFNEGGFSSFTLNGIGAGTSDPEKYLPGLVIAPNTVIAPQVTSSVAVPYPGGDTLALATALYPQSMVAPVSLTFGSIQVRDSFAGNALVVRGDLVMGEGAVIRTNGLGSVTLKGDTVSILGSVIAPGGRINVTGANSFPSNLIPTEALPTVYLGPRSLLSTAGEVVLTPDAFGRRVGSVLPGGVVNVAGNIVAVAGAVIDVSGTSGILDLHPNYLGMETSPLVLPSSGLTTPRFSLLNVPTRVDSNGGIIILAGGQELFMDATLKGDAGGPTATGGTLIVGSGSFSPDEPPTPLTPNLFVTQGGRTIPTGQAGIGKPVLDIHGNPVPGMGYFTANSFLRGGFDSLMLKGVVEFSGPVNIAARGSLIVGTGGVIYADSAVDLSAPYVALGQVFQAPQASGQATPPFQNAGQPFYFPPTYGPGSITVHAEHIDIGNLSLQGIGKVNLIADGGDIRGNGTLNLAGDLYLRAAQVYPAAASTFTMAVYDYVKDGSPQQGSITVASSGVRSLPLEAGGTLRLFASKIDQGGTLRAPLGQIIIGWDGTGTPPVDAIVGPNILTNTNFIPLPTASQVTLQPGSITSVSGVDPVTGRPVLFPYGIMLNGTSWIDPAGNDITTTGPPAKFISISGSNVDTREGSIIDLSGGGDLYAYQWVQGTGGSKDILKSNTSFAIIPGYRGGLAPFGAFNTDGDVTNFNQVKTDPSTRDFGYVNSTLNVGDSIYLDASAALPAGYYTLLPARYALMPGAVLVTPQSGIPIGNFLKPDGASLVGGYRYNNLNGSRDLPEIFSRFEVAPSSVVHARATYLDFTANAFFTDYAKTREANVPRLPIDAGQLVLSATLAMAVNGSVISNKPIGGRGSLIDISSPVDIVINGPGATQVPGSLNLDSSKLNGFGADSLLIGGVRTVGLNGTTVNVKTNNLTLNNASAPLTGADIILVSNQNLTLSPGAQILSTAGSAGQADTILIGNSAIPGSGDGLLVRVSSDPAAKVIRTGISSSALPTMVVGAGSILSGGTVTLDSTSATSLDPTASLLGQTINLNSGQISLALTNPGSLQPTTGLVLSGTALASLQSAKALSLLSYSSLDIYGTGQVGSASLGNLELHAAEIRGFNTGGGTVTFAANDILLDNSSGRPAPGIIAAPTGSLVFNANTIRMGANGVAIDQYADVNMNATGGLLMQGTGSTKVAGNLTISAPIITGAAGASQNLTAGGTMNLLSPSGGGAGTVAGGLGASLNFKGASINQSANILLPSGLLTLESTTGDLVVAGKLNVGGTAQTIQDLVKYTDGGQVKLISRQGNVTLAAGSIVDVAANEGGGNAGTLSISTPEGAFTLDGTVLGQKGAGGRDGSFALDASTISGLTALNSLLNSTGFTESRSFRVRTGDVLLGGTSVANQFRLSADAGSINVIGTINASGVNGGTISLDASNNLTLTPTAILNASGQKFSNAGKGGSVWLGTRGIGGGFIDLQTGSLINLSVASNTPGSAGLGNFTGTLHLRAPQNAASTDLAINPINGTILNASSIVAEGFKVFDLTGAPGANSVITSAIQNSVKANGEAFLGLAGTTTANYTAMRNRLLAGNPGLDSPLFSLQAGAEIINRTGNLTLGTTASNSSSDWNLSGYRFGPNGAAGDLTLRAAGDLTFFNALSDGFATSAYNAAVMAQNTALRPNNQSYSYTLTAGADFSAADSRQVMSLDALGSGLGSLKLGKNAGLNLATSPGSGATTASAVNNRFQVIRTGTGDITISTGRDVQLLNQFATIYTAGVKVTDPTLGGTFDTPVINFSTGGTGTLGSIQQPTAYPAQYTMGGGNVLVQAQGNLEHLTLDSGGNLIADSSRELPNNWLYRRGYVDPLTGKFGKSRFGEEASTTWWVDFSNYFEGVGALGGGDVTLVAGGSINNVDAVVPTNARMSKGIPNAANLLELGGGNLKVKAGGDINGGVYYVERGNAALDAGGSILTNATRTPSRGRIINEAPLDPTTWLPTTLFLGKGNLDIKSRGDLTIGPVVNPFLLPGGYNNSYWYKSYFSTYDPSNQVNVASLTGGITLRQATILPDSGGLTNILQAWLGNIDLLNSTSVSFYQPWLRLNETNVGVFATGAGLMPSALRATAFQGDINVVGNLTLSPSPTGTLDLLAAGAINGLQINGISNQLGTDSSVQLRGWSASTINVSDADPSAIWGVGSPLAYQTVAGIIAGRAQVTGDLFLKPLDDLFAETGSTQGVLQTKQTLHAVGLLHKNDTIPLHLYSGSGDISGLTLFSPKAARITAGRDLTDISLYIQNISSNDVSLVSSGRDIIAYNANAPLRVSAQSAGNALVPGQIALPGDIQISGPGTLEVLAGRNLDLGSGDPNPDGTGAGITSIGNGRNPSLTFAGANIIAGAGLGGSLGLESDTLDFDGFIATYVTQENLTKYQAELTGSFPNLVAGNFASLPKEEQHRVALEVFYRLLRDAGRDHNLAGSPTFGSYEPGLAAIASLFSKGNYTGDISTQTRSIRTASGGYISLFAPGGKLTLATAPVAPGSVPPGIVTEAGGNISIFTDGDVDLGNARIFTLRGGNEIIWSSTGNIAAGSAAKTVASAPPTRVIIDPQSGDVKTDLAGLATGGGIGVLNTVAGVAPGDVDLIAVIGSIDAGDAGIRSAGNLTLAAPVVLNASNIAATGGTTGAPAAPAPTAPSIGSSPPPPPQPKQTTPTEANAGTKPTSEQELMDSLVTVEVIGYGGGGGEEDEDEEERKKREREKLEEQQNAQ